MRSKRDKHSVAFSRARDVSKYVKFTYDRAGAEIARFDQLAELNAYRRKLLEQRLMGVDSNGVGFGNLSVRDGVRGNFTSPVQRRVVCPS